jgi:uncharacterized protein
MTARIFARNHGRRDTLRVIFWLDEKSRDSVRSRGRGKRMEKFRFEVDARRSVSALFLEPSAPRACFVFAHGAGAGMSDTFMEKTAKALFERGIATLRYQFPYMEIGSKRPDHPAVAHATVRAAVNAAKERCPNLMLIAGGKSFGGRMTSQTQAASPLPSVSGLAFFGFLLHAAGKPSTERAVHLFEVTIPMLFLQGSEDKLADPGLMRAITQKLGARATLHMIDKADHSFRVSKRSGQTAEGVIDEVASSVVDWLKSFRRD